MFSNKEKILKSWNAKFSSQMDIIEKASFKNFDWWEKWFKNNYLWEEPIITDLDSASDFYSPSDLWDEHFRNSSASSNWNFNAVQDAGQIITHWFNISYQDNMPNYMMTTLLNNFRHFTIWQFFQSFFEDILESLTSNIEYNSINDFNINWEPAYDSNRMSWQVWALLGGGDDELANERLSAINYTNIYSFKQLLLMVYYISKNRFLNDDVPIFPIIQKILTNKKYEFHDFNLTKNQYINGSLTDTDVSQNLSTVSKKHSFSYNLRGGFLHNPAVFFPMMCRTNLNRVGNNVYLDVSTEEYQHLLTYYTVNKFRGANQSGQSSLLYYLYKIQVPSFCDRIIFPITSWNFNSQLMRWRYGVYSPGYRHNSTMLDFQNLDVDELLGFDDISSILIRPNSNPTPQQNNTVFSENMTPKVINSIYSSIPVSVGELGSFFQNNTPASDSEDYEGAIIRQDWYEYFGSQHNYGASSGFRCDNLAQYTLYGNHTVNNWFNACEEYYANLYNQFPQSKHDLEQLEFNYLEQYPDENYLDFTGKDWIDTNIRKKSQVFEKYNIYFETPINKLSDSDIRITAVNLNENIIFSINSFEIKKLNERMYCVEIPNNELNSGNYIFKIYPSIKNIDNIKDISLLYGYYYEYTDGIKVLKNGIISDSNKKTIDLSDTNLIVYENYFIPIFVEIEITGNQVDYFGADINVSEHEKRNYILFMDRLPKSNTFSSTNYFERYQLYNNKSFDIYDDNDNLLTRGVWPYSMFEMYSPEDNLLRWPEYIDRQYQDKWIIFYEKEPTPQ